MYRRVKFLVLYILVLILIIQVLPVNAASYKEAPGLASLVSQGKLPPVQERLPKNPLVVTPVKKIGEYGGTLRTAGLSRTDYIFRLIGYDGLVRWSIDFRKIMPGLAESWVVGDKGKSYILKLRQGVKWSDGKPFTADDLVFWYNDVLLNKDLTPRPFSWLTTNGQIVIMKKLSDYSVKFTFSEPNSMFLDYLATPDGVSLLVPAHYMRQFHPKYTAQEELSTKLKAEGYQQWTQLFLAKNDVFRNPDRPTLNAWVVASPPSETQRIVYERNPYYWKVDPDGKQLPYIDRVVQDIIVNPEVISMKAMSGELDFIDSLVFASLKDLPMFLENREKGGYRIIRTTAAGTNSVETICFNMNHQDPALKPIITDKRFHYALSSAINRKEIIDMVYFGLTEPRQPSPLPGSKFYYEPLTNAYIKYDPSLANKLLDEMGLSKKDKDGFRLRPDGKLLTITIISPHISHMDTLEMVKNYWNKVGVKTEVELLAGPLFSQRILSANFDVASYWNSGDGYHLLDPRHYLPIDPLNSTFAPLWALWYQSGGKSGEEPPAYVKRQYELWNQIRTTLNSKKQVELMRELLKITADYLPAIGICSNPGFFWVVKNNLINIPDKPINSWVYPHPGPTNPCQYFFEKK